MGTTSLILHAGPVVKFVLLILFFASVICWAIILFKGKRIKKAGKETDAFLKIFWEIKRLEEVAGALKKYENSPAAIVFRSGYGELKKAMRDADDDDQSSFCATRLEMIERSLRRAKNNETFFLERHLNFLATTGSAAPFIGLFGTVWGIMNAFQRIGQTGAASLAVVAPGVSEALIATAIGLAAAIPAVIFYNIYVGKIRRISSELDNLILEFLNIAGRGLRRHSGEGRQ